jgi:hypothetical protein
MFTVECTRDRGWASRGGFQAETWTGIATRQRAEVIAAEMECRHTEAGHVVSVTITDDAS